MYIYLRARISMDKMYIIYGDCVSNKAVRKYVRMNDRIMFKRNL